MIFAFLAVALAAQAPAEQRLANDVNYLASPKLEGRGNGSKGLRLAARYVKKVHKKLGLKTESQTVLFVNRVERASASCKIAGKKLVFGSDVEALGSSGNGAVKGAPIIFAGFGLALDGWNDFSDISPKGAVVAIARNIPDIEALRNIPRPDLELHARIRRIANLGALAVIVLEDGPKPQAIKMQDGPQVQPVPALSLPMDKLSGQWGSAKKLLDSISERPLTMVIPDAPIDLNVRMRQVAAKLPNITAFLHGSDPALSKECIVVGAHLDHIGMGERHSRSGPGELHPGADDNASGSAMVLELARALKDSKPKRSILFIHFSGEEEGLLGSSHWIQCPTVPIPSVKFMVNFDMVGRLDTASPVLHVGGLGATKAILEHSHSLAPNGLTVAGDLGAAMGGSDHMSFAAARIPSYFFFTGIHNDYHTPRDTPDRLNIPGMARIADYAAKVVKDLADAEELPPFDAGALTAGTRRPSNDRRRIAFGTVPDFSGGGGGFKISGTTPGSTAEAVGLKAGDRITSFGGRPISDIYDFMEALGAFKGGDKIVVKWVRDGQEHQAEATLRER